jgi:hypothetical protein
MRYLTHILINVAIVFSSCSDDLNIDFKDTGSITGQDFRRCMCCGGWFVDINSETYRFKEIPKSSDLDLNSAEFPIHVYVDWTTDENGCLGDEIIIEQIEQITLPD